MDMPLNLVISIRFYVAARGRFEWFSSSIKLWLYLNVGGNSNHAFIFITGFGITQIRLNAKICCDTH